MEPVLNSHELPPLPSGSWLDIATLPPASTSDESCMGGRVWKAAPALCAWMAGASDQIAGCSILEVGAGTGACGLFAAALGAGRVVLTDGGAESPPLFSLLEENARRTRCQRPAKTQVEVAALHWGREPLPAGPFDWVIGSDVTWGSDDEAHDGLSSTLAALLRRDAGARCVLAMEHGLPIPVDAAALMAPPYRDETLEQFRSAARPHGLQVVSLASPGGEAAPPAEPGQAEMLWPAEAFSAFTPHTTSEVFLVEVRLAFG